MWGRAASCVILQRTSLRLIGCGVACLTWAAQTSRSSIRRLPALKAIASSCCTSSGADCVALQPVFMLHCGMRVERSCLLNRCFPGVCWFAFLGQVLQPTWIATWVDDLLQPVFCSIGADMSQTFAIGIGGAAGQGVATPGDIFAKIFSRRGLHLNAYNAYQSIIRGGHTFLTIRTGPEGVSNMGDRIDLLIPLNQDTMDRHLTLLLSGAACLFNADTIKPGTPADGVQMCPIPVSKLADISRNKVAQNTLAIGAGLSMMGIGFA